jgi:hypothetical protein
MKIIVVDHEMLQIDVEINMGALQDEDSIITFFSENA